MAYLHLQLHKSLLKKVKKEASRLNVKRKLLMSAAIQAFIENPPETINLPPMLIRLAIVRYLNLIEEHREVMQSVSKANITLVT